MTLTFASALMILGAVTCANAVFLLSPRDTEVVYGNSTYLNCSFRPDGMPQDIVWYHYDVGARGDRNNEVYIRGELQPPYKGRLTVEKTSNVSANLVFPSAKYNDVGTYACLEGGSRKNTSAQLIVLGSLPVCETNISGVIIKSKCGVEPDRIVISCRVSYRGNISSSLEWTTLGSNESLSTYNNCTVQGNVITCLLTLEADQVTDGVTYVCRTMKSGKTEYSCSTEKFKVINAFDSDSPIKRSLNDEVNCLETSSPLCTYKWEWNYGEISKMVSHNLTLTLTEPGRYRCEAECRISYNVCTIVAVVVDAETISDQNADSTQAILFLIVLVAAVCIVVVTVAGCCIHCKSTRQSKPVGERRYSARVSVKSDSEADQVEEELDEVEEFDDGIPDNTVTSFMDMRTDQTRYSADITTDSQFESNVYTNEDE